MIAKEFVIIANAVLLKLELSIEKPNNIYLLVFLL